MAETSDKPKTRVENVIATAKVGENLNLFKISTSIEGADYNPETFPGIIFNLKNPKTVILIFRSGRVVCTGAHSLEDARAAIDIIVKKLESAEIEVDADPEMKVKTIITSTDFGKELDLREIADILDKEKVEYDPDEFPGLIYKIREQGPEFLMFKSGVIVCTGCKKTKQIEKFVGEISDKLNDAQSKKDE
jgi:transcription initiation factor TFIID TATA-box-binding protein